MKQPELSLLGKRVLIVDDEPDIREFISYNLTKRGFLVAVACDGTEGYSLALKFEPDLILLDVLMPGLNGFETCMRLRSNERFDNTQIVFLSALTQSYSKDLGFRMNADAFITKPVRMELLVRKIEQLMSEKAFLKVTAEASRLRDSSTSA
jgi:two-component system alkaline phosphatase synthesis response regulator PhoP